MNTFCELPEPDPAAIAVSERLTDHIKNEIAENGGWISFQRFMDMALYEPGLGYYSGGSVKMGKEGDFITAPEIASLFSRCVARQCEEILHHLNGGDILELGAGSGVMARDLLRALAQADCLPDHYFILETSADLRQRQQQLIRDSVPVFAGIVRWIDTLPEKAIQGLVLANEVIDALPVRRFRLHEQTLVELGVGINGNNFCYLEHEPGDDLQWFIEKINLQRRVSHSEEYCSEWNDKLEPWVAGVANTIQQGVIVFIDYGCTVAEYYHPDKTNGSLLCHYRHRVHDDPFIYPGLQDITAYVDFTAVAEAAIKQDLNVRGYTTQAHFLLSTGISDMLNSTATGSEEYMRRTHEVKQLTLPGEMGERFKVMALSRDYDGPLMGFGMSDQRGRL